MSYKRALGASVGRGLGLALREVLATLPTGLCVLAGTVIAFPAVVTQSWDALRQDAPVGHHRVAGWVDGYHQCYVRGVVDGTPFTFLLDTGATDLSFNRAHAQQLGLSPARLRYDHTIATANGIGRAASIRVRDLRLGEFVLKDVPAFVDDAGADAPLLGMSVLKFMHLQFARGACWLTW